MKDLEIKSVPIEEAEFCVLDVETTGTSARYHRVIEIGMVQVKNLEIKKTYRQFINPGAPVPSVITGITGITTADVINEPPFENFVPEITDFIGHSILTAHNYTFDHGFLREEFLRNSFEFPGYTGLCTLKLARRLFPELPSKSLGNVTSHLSVVHKNVHRALGDALVTAKILLKMIDILREEHHIETLGELLAFQNTPGGRSGGYRITKKKLAGDFASLPDGPGVYFFKNAKDKIYYIGKAKSLIRRVKNYFSESAARKAKKISVKSSRLGFIETNTELTALIAEAELIKKHKPPMNTMLKKYSGSHFIRVSTTQEFPKLGQTQKFDFDGNDYFGPYSKRDTAAAMLNIIDKTFAVRECTEKDFRKGKRCYLADLKRCIAPCENGADSEMYKEELCKVYDFLSGNNQYAVNRLLEKMKILSGEQKYEQAAEVRDTVNLLMNQLNRSSILAEPVNRAKVLIKVRGALEDDFLLLIEGKVIIKGKALNEDKLFETALDDYFSGTLHLFKGIDDKDLERMKIMLSWLVKNRTRVSIFYLENYSSKEELEKKIIK